MDLQAAGNIGLYVIGEDGVVWTNPVYRCCDGYIGSNGDCFAYTTCTASQAETQAPTATSDRVCV